MRALAGIIIKAPRYDVNLFLAQFAGVVAATVVSLIFCNNYKSENRSVFVMRQMLGKSRVFPALPRGALRVQVENVKRTFQLPPAVRAWLVSVLPSPSSCLSVRTSKDLTFFRFEVFPAFPAVAVVIVIIVIVAAFPMMSQIINFLAVIFGQAA